MEYKEVIKLVKSVNDRKALIRGFKGMTGAPKEFEKYRNEILNKKRIKEEMTDLRQMAKKAKNHSLRDLVVVTDLVMEVLLNSVDYYMREDKLYEEVQRIEESIVMQAKNYKIPREGDAKKFQQLLKIAWENKNLSSDEFILLRKAMSVFDLTKKEKWLIEANTGFFPKENRKIHKEQEINDILKYLRDRAIVFPIKSGEQGKKGFIIPDEIGRILREVYEVDLQRENIERMLKESSLYKKAILGFLCDEFKVFGKRRSTAESLKSISTQGISARKILRAVLTRYRKNFQELAKEAGANQKHEGQQINCIIRKFDVSLKPDYIDKEDKRAKLFDHYEDLAERSTPKLVRDKIIKGSEEIGKKFEEATKYIFEKYFQLTPELLSGKNRPDFVLKYNGRKCIIGDCKTSLKVDNHRKNHMHFKQQFLDYIKKYRGNKELQLRAFLVIVPEAYESSKRLAEILKIETDIDTAIISAEEFKRFAQYWVNKNKSLRRLNLELFNYKGVLSYDELVRRLETFEKMSSREI